MKRLITAISLLTIAGDFMRDWISKHEETSGYTDAAVP